MNSEFEFPLDDVGLADDLIVNALYREQLLSRFMAENEYGIETECGYPPTEMITIDMLYNLFRRDPIARRVVEILPRECWRKNPELFDDQDEEKVSPFEESFRQMCRDLSSNSKAHYKTAIRRFWSTLETADVLSGVGSYGVVIIGIDDGLPLSEPIKGFEDEKTDDQYDLSTNAEKEEEKGKGKKRKGPKLLYLQPYSEKHIAVVSYETDKTSPRYTEPTAYRITTWDENARANNHAAPPTSTEVVHWSRVVHIVNYPEDSEVVVDSRLMPVYDRILDLRKVYGPSAEGFWQGSIPGLSFEPMEKDVKIDQKAIAEAVTLYRQKLKRHLAAQNAKIKTMPPSIVDPSGQIDIQINAICIVIGVPRRIFEGSERGQLASGQDSDSHDERIESRRETQVTPRIICPVVDRLIKIGVLIEPEEDGYVVEWPPLRGKTAATTADLAAKNVDALSKYIKGGVVDMITPLDFLVKFLDIPVDEAEEMLENATQLGDEAAEDEAKAAEELAKEQAKFGPPPGAPLPPGTPPVSGKPGGPPPAKPGVPPKAAAGPIPPGRGNPAAPVPPAAPKARLKLKPTANNCGIGPGGFTPGNSCAKGGGGGPDSVPVPKYISSNKANVSANVSAGKEMLKMAKDGDLAGLKAHPGTGSAKLKDYQAALVKSMSESPKAPKPAEAPKQAPKPPKAEKTTPKPSQDLEAVRQAVSEKTGLTKAQIKDALSKDASPNNPERAKNRAKIESAILEGGLGRSNAVLELKDTPEAIQSRIHFIHDGDNVARSKKEYAQTPLYDLNTLSRVEVKSFPIEGQAVCYTAERRLVMGSTSVTGDFRHELGHAIRFSMGESGAMPAAVTQEHANNLARVKKDPPGNKKLTHEEYETKYGVVGRRGLDNKEENAAEHYRLYHREVYRDKNEGGGGKNLDQYRKRHPGWSKIFDAHYTAAQLGE